MFVGSCFITLKENPKVYPWIKIFSYGLPTQNHGEGEGWSMSEICCVPGVSFTSRRVRIIKTVARRGLRLFCHFWNVKNNIQLSPERGGEWWCIYTDTRSVEVYIQGYEPTLRGIVVLVFNKSVGKNQKGTFCKQTTSLSQSLFTIQWTVFQESFFMILLQIQWEIFFLAASKRRQAQFCLHLSLTFYISKLLRNGLPFGISSKNSECQRIFRVTGANQNAWKLLSTDLLNTKTNYQLGLVIRVAILFGSIGT